MERTEMQITQDWLNELKFIENECAVAVSDVRQYVTKGMAERLERARQVTGMKFDTANQKYIPLEGD